MSSHAEMLLENSRALEKYIKEANTMIKSALPQVCLPVPVSESFSQLSLPLAPVVDVEGENSGVLREGPGHPDVAVILRHDQRNRHGQTNQRHQQPEQRGQ